MIINAIFEQGFCFLQCHRFFVSLCKTYPPNDIFFFALIILFVFYFLLQEAYASLEVLSLSPTPFISLSIFFFQGSFQLLSFSVLLIHLFLFIIVQFFLNHIYFFIKLSPWFKKYDFNFQWLSL